MVKPQNELTLDEVTRIAQNSPFLSWIDFTGGEPTDRPDFPEVIGAFLSHCPDLLLVHFPTNGLKPDHIEETTRKILSLRPPRLVITVSIDGPPKVNDAIRGIKGDFQKATETYSRLRELPGAHVYVGMTLYPNNVGLVDETVDAIRGAIPGFTYRDLHVNIPHVSGHFFENVKNAPAVTAEMVQVIDRYMRARGAPRTPFEWVERLYQRRIRQYIETQKTPMDCASLLSSCYLGEDGTVYPCLIWDEPLGNVREHGYSLLPIFKSARARELREKVVAKDCPNCWTPCEAYQTLAANVLRRG
jgi:MoaA/NifB/PqqE/SkfB family radical SAM enzyme